MSFDQRRYQIFISSTFADLKEQRKQAVEVVFQHGHIPIALENFAASNQSDLEVIREVIRDCQVYILILGHRYGELVPGQDFSFTELEYNIAEERGLLILPFLMNPEEIGRRRANLDPNSISDAKELENAERLRKFHERIRRFRRLWSSDDQFKFLVLQSLVDNLANCERPGFIQEAAPDATEMLLAAAKNPIIVDIVGRLEGFSKLHERCSEQVAEKQAVASFLREHFIDRVINRRMSLFFESGSTVAYIAKEWGPTLANHVVLDGEEPNIQISTNNVLAYLELWLKFRIPCAALPWGPPSDETFGASYGGGLERIAEKSPQYVAGFLDVVAEREIDKLMDLTFGLRFRPPVLLFGAVSGLQVSAEPHLHFPSSMDEHSRDKHRKLISGCRGPFVESYHNKIFKRFMYKTQMPLVVAITGEKVNGPIEVFKSHFILDEHLQWESMLSTHPLAFCVGCQQSERDRLIELFQGIGFRIREGSHRESVAVFLAVNDEFARRCEEVLDGAQTEILLPS